MTSALCVLTALSASLDLTAAETAGIRRFGYPVKVKLSLPDDLTGKERFRLTAGGKVVQAQFRPVGKREVWLDFNCSPAPLEKLAVRVEYGPDVEAGPEPKAGVTVKEDRGVFTVRSGGMSYTLPAGLEGLLGEVRGGKREYMKAGSKGLFIETAKGPLPVAGLTGRVVREGPMAVALEYLGKVAGRTVRVELTFPRSKSWAEVDFMCDGADVRGVGADLGLTLSSPALVDFGAGTGVYVALKKGETATMEAWNTYPPKVRERFWETRVGARPYVIPPNLETRSEGWAHAMDRERCTALAVEMFGRLPVGHPGIVSAEMSVGAEGAMRFITRGKVRTRFWLHFVPTPVHVGALTSPQAMLSPLKVEVKGR